MPNGRLILCLSLLASVSLARAGDGGSGADRSIRASVGFHFSTGDYGTSDTTDIYYVPLVMRARSGAWTAWLTVPYLRISGGGGTVQGPQGPIATSGGTNDGLGDVLLRGSYLVSPFRRWLPYVELVSLVKFPTASERDGLGTGRFDFGFETEVSWDVGRFTPFGMIGYRFLGSSPSIPLHDVYVDSVGLQYRLFDRLDVGLLLDHRQSASKASGVRRELLPFASYRAGEHWWLGGYASAGLADGSPDAGVGIEVGWSR
jgi:hypothetical protein